MSISDELDALAEPKTEPLGGVDIGPDGGEFHDIKTDHPITDWTEIFQRFNLDPAKFRVVDDTVRMSTWQQSRRLANGDRDIINLYSYRANFSRVTSHDKQVAELLASKIEPIRPTHRQAHGDDALCVCISDVQTGKRNAGRGTIELEHRFDSVLAQIVQHMSDSDIRELIIADVGDCIENVESHTSVAQITSNDLSLPEQIREWQRLLTKAIITLAPYADHTTCLTVPSNHGQWRRNGQQMGDADWGLSVMRTVQDAFQQRPEDWSLDFQLPEHDWDIANAITVNGCNIVFTHGHHARRQDNIPDWVMRQASTPSNPYAKANVCVSGHFHNARVVYSSNGRTLIECPTIDGGSQYFTDSTGEWSEPGMAIFHVNDGRARDIRIIEP